jgi:acetyl/propionyl-CoA carboxylase alpha subunit
MHLFERECSIQRRFQKIIEECPSPAPSLTPAIREALCTAGVTAARAMGYEGAGTVEFLLDALGRFYFLEVNTRLQVEHPVTEMVTGLDLVRLQILVAQGARLADLVPEVHPRGHAIEARVYAEDPATDFLPATGRLLEWSPPEGAGVRVDAGVSTGSTVGIDYDPLLAKVVAWGPTRAEAVLRLRGALRRLGVQGVTTNRTFLRAVLAHPAFAAGDTQTHFIADHFPLETRAAVPSAAQVELAAMAAALVDAEGRLAAARLVPAVRPGFRLDHAVPQWVEFSAPTGDVRVEYETRARGLHRARLAGPRGQTVPPGPWREVTLAAEGTGYRVSLDGHAQHLSVVVDGPVHGVRGAELQVRLVEKPRFPEPERATRAGGCEAPMPGRVVQVLVRTGDAVDTGTPLVILEAMKMEQTLTASGPAVVGAVRVAAGDRVEAGAVLVELGAAPSV